LHIRDTFKVLDTTVKDDLGLRLAAHEQDRVRRVDVDQERDVCHVVARKIPETARLG